MAYVDNIITVHLTYASIYLNMRYNSILQIMMRTSGAYALHAVPSKSIFPCDEKFPSCNQKKNNKLNPYLEVEQTYDDKVRGYSISLFDCYCVDTQTLELA